jgi:TetR/AcrR family transcriptional repressor of mexJK operon
MGLGANAVPAEIDAKEAAIIGAARKMFLVHGYDGASMDEIALAAQVSKRTVYNRFRSKEELFAATIEESCRRVLPVNIDAIEQSLSTEAFTSELAHLFLRAMLEAEALALRRIASFEAGRNPALGRLYHEHGLVYMKTAFAPILKRAADREGIVLDEIDTALYQLGALIMEPLYTEALLGVAPDDLESAIDRQIDRGLAAFWKIYVR